MNILLTNDDGFDFPGIIALQESLSRLGKAFIVAPERDTSGASQAITLMESIRVKKINPYTYSVKGFPADCVNIGLNGELFPDKIDLVVSGINKGVNMGADIWYSGTVGGARHAFIHGYSGIAISCGYYNEQGEYHKVADFMADFITDHFLNMERPLLLSINYPIHREIKGIKWSRLGKRVYKDSYATVDAQGDEYTFKFHGSELTHAPQAGSDFDTYYEGYISVTALTLDATDYQADTKELRLNSKSGLTP